jgi:predicted acylesterase/phospholipase RssA
VLKNRNEGGCTHSILFVVTSTFALIFFRLPEPVRGPTARLSASSKLRFREWAYARAYQNSDPRSAELLNWLHRYWHRPHGRFYGNFGLDHSPGYVFVDVLTQFLSPYQLNPLNYNPFKKLLEEVMDFELVRRQTPIKLFLCATNVRTGKVKVFGAENLRSDHVVASSCQPLMMHAVEIDGEYYWDGGFMGNPALFPVIYACQARDVHLTPFERPEHPTTALAILSRMQEVAFNSSLMREMRAVADMPRAGA